MAVGIVKLSFHMKRFSFNVTDLDSMSWSCEQNCIFSALSAPPTVINWISFQKVSVVLRFFQYLVISSLFQMKIGWTLFISNLSKNDWFLCTNIQLFGDLFKFSTLLPRFVSDELLCETCKTIYVYKSSNILCRES